MKGMGKMGFGFIILIIIAIVAVYAMKSKGKNSVPRRSQITEVPPYTTEHINAPPGGAYSAQIQHKPSCGSCAAKAQRAAMGFK